MLCDGMFRCPKPFWESFMDMHYTEADKRLAQSLLKVDLGELSSALADGATAHKEPFRGVSWSLIPLHFNAKRGGGEAGAEVAKQMMRYLIQEGSPVKGMSLFVSSGHAFSVDDVNYLLDNGLWREADELRNLAITYLDNDDIMVLLIGTGHVPASLPVGDSTLFERVCLNGLHRSAYEFAGLGANMDASVTVGGEVMTLMEAAAKLGHPAVVNSLIKSGAFYEAERLLAKAESHSAHCARIVNKCLAAFEMGVDMPDEDVLAHLRLTAPGAGTEH
jgi:hypothetical protein